MTDRELLERAARAIGRKLYWDDGEPCFDDLMAPKHRLWSPLTDDGDALRLFLALPWMVIETSDVGVCVRERGEKGERVYLKWTEYLEDHNSDIRAATRRAIVRAAAAMEQAK